MKQIWKTGKIIITQNFLKQMLVGKENRIIRREEREACCQEFVPELPVASFINS